MKKTLTLSLIALLVIGASVTEVNAQSKKKESVKSELSKRKMIRKQKLVWSDEFNDGAVDLRYWDTIPRGGSDWSKYMSNDPSLIYFEDGNLVLDGRINPDAKSPKDRYVTGGLWTKGKFNIGYGRIDFRAKVEEAEGAWPAIWLLPDGGKQKWPDGGEIDVMEHLNKDEFVYQTTHSRYTFTLKNTENPKNSRTAKIKRNDYNIYSLAWNEDVIQWFVNGKPTHVYPRVKTEEAAEQGQWPHGDPLFILLSQQLGGPGTWVGEINDDELPVKMFIDWVRVYEYED